MWLCTSVPTRVTNTITANHKKNGRFRFNERDIGVSRVRMNSGLREQFKPDRFYYSINYYSTSELRRRCLHGVVRPLRCMVDTAMTVDP